MIKNCLRKKKRRPSHTASNVKAAHTKGGFFPQMRQTETLTGEGYHDGIHSLHR